jgi:bifunctional oligoribonuclease and PAP phosphatase NrnA
MTTRTKNNTLAEIAQFSKTLDKVAVTTHVGADGDAIGASAALVRLMRRLGAEAVFCHAEAVPEYLEWLLPEEARTGQGYPCPTQAPASTSTTTRTTPSTPSTTW